MSGDEVDAGSNPEPSDWVACDALIQSRYPARADESDEDKVKRLRFALHTYSEAWTRATSKRERRYLILREYDTLQNLRHLGQSSDDHQ